MSAGLATRQRALVAALGGNGNGNGNGGGGVDGLRAPGGIAGGVPRGLQAYRLNAQALSARALAAVFPRLHEALGEASFDAMAWTFWRRHPPEHGDLGLWGGRLADFLGEQDGIDVALCDQASLEWALHGAERAADTELDAASLELLATQPPAALGLRLRPGLQLLTQRQDGRRLLVWRQGWRAHWRPLDAATAALLQTLLDGGDLAAALDAALRLDAAFDFSAWLQTALREDWLHAAVTLDRAPSRS
jgi:hypothetical protein